LIDAKVPVVPGPSSIGFKACASRPTTALVKFLKSPQFLVQSNAVGKFLEILSWLYRQDPEKFKAVLDIRAARGDISKRDSDRAGAHPVEPIRVQ
jgi:hypothetical protein